MSAPSQTATISATLYMDAVLRPQRSMTPAGFGVLIGIVAFMNLVVGTVFFLAHAPFIPIFLGIDVLAVWLAFRASFKAAKRGERIRVSAEKVEVLQEGFGAPRTLWTSPTAFTRVAVDDLGEEEWRVRLHLSGQKITLARALSPEQRRDFARQLDDAIRAARSERHVS